MRFVGIFALLFSISSWAFAQNHIAPTEAKTPAEELKSFQVPAGFEVQLVAAEPDIGKPIQIAFDAKGRLWATTSRHYPFAAGPGEKMTDKLFVLSDFGPDGRAKKIETFADNLNIPIGVLPLPDGKSCLVSEVGQIVKLTDTDGDGKADKKEPILTGFGTKDTHGMMNSFLLQPDGWVYACHGFANDSQVVGRDGSKISMNSGNTFRFKPDGTQVQNWTFGQVNPFGLTADPWGNLYTADCHSKPITQLIPQATYSSFSKPHDGLGFAPHVTRHDHGSTALCGLAWYDQGNFPTQYRGAMFLGNVVMNRINSDKIIWKGSTPVAEELPDFVTSSDLWFRPTDIKVGPDGALYFADFYNRIIGHYEVDLKHPQRDKDRGRLWRVVWKSEPGVNPVHEDAIAPKQLREAAYSKAMTPDMQTILLDNLRLAEPQVRRAAIDALIVHPTSKAIEPLVTIIAGCPSEDTHLQHAARVALRNCLQSPEAWPIVETLSQDKKSAVILADVSVGVPTKLAAQYLTKQLQAGKIEARFCERIGRYGDDEAATAAVEAILKQSKPVAALKALVQGLQSRGSAIPATALTRIEKTCEEGLASKDGDQLLESMGLAGNLRIRNVYDPLVTLASMVDRPDAQRAEAFSVIMQIEPVKATPVLVKALSTPTTSAALRDRLVGILAGANTIEARTALLTALQTAPTRLAVSIAAGLAQSPAGATALLEAVKQGKASARLLQERPVAVKLQALDGGKFRGQVAELTKGLPSADAKTEELLKARAQGYVAAKPSVERGKAIYTTQCANCHQLGGAGAKIGPQLDGIGIRGLERLLEDTLDPNRNVDAEFRTTVLNLTDGRTLSGLVLREEGQTVILADALGKEVRINTSDIDKRTRSPLSPMPANFDTTLKPEEYYDLMAYLLEQRVK
jgi:putative heme-binding domain-containing protein